MSIISLSEGHLPAEAVEHFVGKNYHGMVMMTLWWLTCLYGICIYLCLAILTSNEESHLLRSTLTCLRYATMDFANTIRDYIYIYIYYHEL